MSSAPSSVVSGRISGQTETLPLFVRKQFEIFNHGGGYAASMVLAVIALLTLLFMNLINTREGESDVRQTA